MLRLTAMAQLATGSSLTKVQSAAGIYLSRKCRNAAHHVSEKHFFSP
jgi:hypothetical protein